MNLTHWDTFIHGPFECSSVNGCKTQDCVSQTDWNVLKSHCNMFHNPLPHILTSFLIQSCLPWSARAVSQCYHCPPTALNDIPCFWSMINPACFYHLDKKPRRRLHTTSKQIYIYIQPWSTLQCAQPFILSILQESWLSVIWYMVCNLPLWEQTFSPCSSRWLSDPHQLFF